jgi:hypothetical protein
MQSSSFGSKKLEASVEEITAILPGLHLLIQQYFGIVDYIGSL